MSYDQLITTIIPTYRRPQLLRRAIISVLQQSYPHLRVCVFDNASGDATAEVVGELARQDSRVSYYCHPENIGGQHNFLFGLSQVKTPYFSLLSDDDWILPDCYATAMEGFTRYPEAALSATRVLIQDKDGNTRQENFLQEGYFTPPESLYTMLNVGCPLWTGIVFRSTVLQDVGTLDLKTGMLSDVDFELRIAACSPYVVSNKAGAIFVSHADSISGSQFSQLQRVWPGCEVMRKNVVEHPRLKPEARGQAQQFFLAWLMKHMRYMALSALIRAEYAEMLRIAAVMREPYGYTTIAQLISVIARLCQAFPPLHRFLVLLNKGRNQYIRLRHARLRQPTKQLV